MEALEKYTCSQETNEIQVFQKLERFTSSKALHKVTNASDVLVTRWHAGSCLLNCPSQILASVGLELVVVGYGHGHLQLIGCSGNRMFT